MPLLRMTSSKTSRKPSLLAEVYRDSSQLYTPAFSPLTLLIISLPPARGGLEVEQKARFNAPKIKQLKVLDAKSAQNICESLKY